MIEVSAGIVYDREGRILICQRGEGRNNAHLWEFPGGKREAGESAAQCLIRELQEELHLPVTDVQEVDAWPHGEIRFTFLSAKTDAQPVLTEHEAARFVFPLELLDYDFCPADIPMARKLAFAKVRHVFWDFDGTLLDSYPAMVRAFVAAAADYGIAITPERTLTLMKNCLTHCCEVVGAENGIAPVELVRAFRRHEAEELRRGLPTMPGVEHALRTLHDLGVKHYVATHRDLVCRELLDMAGMLPLFDGFVTQENALPRKPAPDMLLHLIRIHGLDPAECLMVGARPLDTESGRNAGCLSALIDPEGRFPGAVCDVHVQSADVLLRYIMRWMNLQKYVMMIEGCPDSQ